MPPLNDKFQTFLGLKPSSARSHDVRDSSPEPSVKPASGGVAQKAAQPQPRKGDALDKQQAVHVQGGVSADGADLYAALRSTGTAAKQGQNAFASI